MARVWNNVTNLEVLKNRTILQLLKNQDDLLKEFASEIDRIEGVANTAVGTANNALSVATTARAESTAALQTAQAANSKSDEAKADAADAKTAAQNAANAAVAAQGSAAAAENSAGQAANSANTAVGTANNALSVATTARAESTAALQTAQAANSKSDEAKADAADAKTAAQAANSKSDEAKADAAAAETAAQNAANAAVAAQGSAGAAENSASQAANSAAAAAADAAKVNQLETKVNKNTSDISTINEDLATAWLDIGAIETREAGYGKSLSINGNSLSLMHDANTLSTVTIPGGGGSTGLPAPVEMTGWSTTADQEGVGKASLTGCYSIKLNEKSYLIYGGRLSAGLVNGNQSVTIIPPDELGNVSFAAGWAHSGKLVAAGLVAEGQNLLITTNASGVAGQLRVVGGADSLLGKTTYNNEFLDGFLAIVTFE